jgi:serine O-acetyltransferase
MFDFLFGAISQQATPAADRYAEPVAQLTQLLQPLDVDLARAIKDFSTAIPVIHSTLLDDAHAVLDFDPAATSLAEVIAAYPGFYAIAIYRLAHQLAHVGVPLLPRMLSAYAQSKTGIDIHPTAQIGCSFVIDHGTGVVIGATAHIGNHVTLYHGVTLQVKKSEANVKRHPTIEDHVTIYANATMLGDETVIGRN